MVNCPGDLYICIMRTLIKDKKAALEAQLAQNNAQIAHLQAQLNTITRIKLATEGAIAVCDYLLVQSDIESTVPSSTESLVEAAEQV